MGFRENYLKKIRADRMAEQVRNSIGPPGSGQRADLETMRSLLELGPFDYRRERDLDLYMLDSAGAMPMILVLDNELKIYRTTVEDVALRKSPTVKEMISIRNAVKILNDAKVVAFRKAETVEQVRSKIVDALDLSFSSADIEALVNDGRAALKNNYEDGLVEVLSLFAELSGYAPAPRPFQLTHQLIWGRIRRPKTGEIQMGPLIMFDRMHGRLAMVDAIIASTDKSGLQRLQQIAKGETEADVAGEAVFEALQERVKQLGRLAG
jgi:hypothetical protein